MKTYTASDTNTGYCIAQNYEVVTGGKGAWRHLGVLPMPPPREPAPLPEALAVMARAYNRYLKRPPASALCETPLELVRALEAEGYALTKI